MLTRVFMSGIYIATSGRSSWPKTEGIDVEGCNCKSCECLKSRESMKRHSNISSKFHQDSGANQGSGQVLVVILW